MALTPFTLKMAVDEVIAGVYTLDSELDGPDVLSDVGVYDGTYDNITADATDVITVTLGTDQLAGNIQAGSMDVAVGRPDDPGYWNPLNPASPLNLVYPGFTPFRPAQLEETDGDGAQQKTFTGFLRTARWRETTRRCDLHFEDLLYRASRIWPVIAATGPTTTGAVIDLLWDAVGYTGERTTAVGDPLDDFEADGSKNVPTILGELVAAERGTVFIRGDGVPVYESRDMPQARAPSAWQPSTAVDVEELESGIDGDSILTRATVTKTGLDGSEVETWSSIDAAAEHEFGRGDVPPVSSPYVPSTPPDAGQLLADDLVYQGAHGLPPIIASAGAVLDDADDAATLTAILTSPLQTVFALDDSFGGTAGDMVIQRIVHTIGLPGVRRAVYTMTRRPDAAVVTLDSELDGTDVWRY